MKNSIITTNIVNVSAAILYVWKTILTGIKTISSGSLESLKS